MGKFAHFRSCGPSPIIVKQRLPVGTGLAFKTRSARFSRRSTRMAGPLFHYPNPCAFSQEEPPKMFCPNCSQAFQPERTSTCPNCGLSPVYGRRGPSKAALAFEKDERKSPGSSADTSAVDAGVRKGVNLILIGVAFLPVYKILVWLYPVNHLLTDGTQSIELFQMAGQGILFLLFGAGVLRVIFAMTVVRNRALRSAAGEQ